MVCGRTIAASSRCPPYGACLLGSINLAALVIDPFTDNARLDEAELQRIVPVAVRFMDNVVDVSNYPLAGAARGSAGQAAHRPRHHRACRCARHVRPALWHRKPRPSRRGCGWRRSRAPPIAPASALAREKGAFPLFDREPISARRSCAALPEDIRADIAKHGIRNALLTSIAPTGTISLFAGNVSSGIEPIFSIAYERKVLMPDGTKRTEKVEDYAARALARRSRARTRRCRDAFVTANDLTPHEHLIMQAAVQRHIDSLDLEDHQLPARLSFEDFKAVYLEAYELGLKGCTTFRPNEVTGSVLCSRAPRARTGAGGAAARSGARSGAPCRARRSHLHEAAARARTRCCRASPTSSNGPNPITPSTSPSTTSCRTAAGGPSRSSSTRRTWSIIAWTVALTRMISAVFRRGGDVSFVVEELKAVFDPRGGQWMEGRYVPSLLAAIGGIIEKHMIDTGFLKIEARSRALALAVGDDKRAAQCPRCGEAALVFQEGCSTCLSCGYSKCS